MKKKIIMLLFIFAVLIFCREVFADTLYLKNGNQFTGHVVRQEDEMVIFNIGEADDSVEVTFFNDEILRIDKAEVSSFITLPFGNDKQINIPRPIFKQQPVISEEVKLQKEQKAKIEAARQAAMQKEELAQADLEIIKLGEAETPDEELEEADDQVEAESQQASTQVEDLSSQDSDEKIDITSEIVPKDIDIGVGVSPQVSNVTEELTRLLEAEEKEYFMRINSMVQGIAGKMAIIMSNPTALMQKGNALNKLVAELPPEIDQIVAKLGSLQVPELFVNFHKQYLGNFSLVKEVLSGMSIGDVIGSQSKMQELQSTQLQLQEELQKILAIKKSQK